MALQTALFAEALNEPDPDAGLPEPPEAGVHATADPGGGHGSVQSIGPGARAPDPRRDQSHQRREPMASGNTLRSLRERLAQRVPPR